MALHDQFYTADLSDIHLEEVSQRAEENWLAIEMR